MRRLFFSWWYLFRPPWDSGIPAPELVRTIANQPPGRALDVGCGTGTNVRYLAEQGWHATGIDYAPSAIARAKRKTKDLAALTTLLVGDVTKLETLPLPGPFDLALDMGCFHSLNTTQHPRYAAGLAHWLRPGAQFLLYAFQPDETQNFWGVPREAVLSIFAPHFRLANYEQGQGRPSAWYYFERIAD